ncbi:hypothetical protein QWY85_05025 [Neolewinella lacunae]|uniref:Tetratricopeptide repeat protein n=1 Tax=Neolewinella lacunae TaxID=1517758 RepID=A0A923T8Z4_9BACT|nr:hypothetical protein [Neolewinella lacunae]MBC6996160.1 hypothetical protein [Neolewinella lacunae]MDN3634011.1 hypothetical protein [Neolewinella lacunae]
MTEEDLRSERIDAYLYGRCTAEEAEKFRRDVSLDESLAEDLALHRLAWEALELMEEDRLRAKFPEWQAEGEKILKNSSNNKLKRWWWLSLLLPIIGLLYWMSRPTQVSDTPALPPPPSERPVPNDPPTVTPIANRPEPNPAPAVKNPVKNKNLSESSEQPALAIAMDAYQKVEQPTLRSAASAPETSPLLPALEAFFGKDYDQAINLLQNSKAQLSPVEQETAQELLANALFLAQRFEEAAAIFQQFTSPNEPALVQQYGQWHLLLCRLAVYPRQKENFRELLEGILANPKHRYYAAAQKLRQETAGW